MQLRDKNLTVMIVDDDEDDRELFCEAVNEINANLKCVNAENGEIALQYLENNSLPKPDYIFLDLNMPRLNGKQCLAEIRRRENLKHIPVIIYSTATHQQDKSQMMELGANGFIHKPTEFHTLCKELRRWIA